MANMTTLNKSCYNIVFFIVAFLAIHCEAAVSFELTQHGDNIHIVAVSSPSNPAPAPTFNDVDYSTWTLTALAVQFTTSWKNAEKLFLLELIGNSKPKT